ncbi:chymotrypsin-1-like [Agrilus planipennis]|uniref:Chymotrypsin-1-like n=1 Tax=Agrilus planipennis TaxID=224129 RepID=A0A1W4W6L1_AGRPL|nr:chymotrypsin-1-like [Agrilus planipennis]
MKLSIFAVIVSFAILSEISALDDSTRIVNGEDTKTGQFPFMVSVKYRGSHNCGGTIISSKWILTAAHCILVNYVSLMTILYGTIHLQNGRNPVNNTAKVARAIVHENYQDYGGYENDIGVIELEDEIEINGLANPILLNTRERTFALGTRGILVGWGYNKTNGTVPDTLQYTAIEVFDSSYCINSYNSSVLNPAVHICAGLVHGGKGQCSGDSGGPLVVNGHQVGIVSWSDKPCASPGKPGVFTRVSTYIDWIYDKTGISLYKS